MWDLVGNPEDRFSHDEAQIVVNLPLFSFNTVGTDDKMIIEPCCEKTGLRGF